MCRRIDRSLFTRLCCFSQILHHEVQLLTVGLCCDRLIRFNAAITNQTVAAPMSSSHDLLLMNFRIWAVFWCFILI